MPTCAALGCGARSGKGDILNAFPRNDLQRRQVWIDRVNRPGWSPTKYSALCELHFDKDQWELPREDGKRKLKNNALPSVFSIEHLSNHDVVATDHAYCFPRLRKLYDDPVSDAEAEPLIPIEHIKVEVNENEDLSPELSEVEDVIQEGSEDIQCTPDIFLYQETEEPEPMEVVHCEIGEPTVTISEPSNDPLAISADDLVKSDGVVPNFPHHKKYVFVPNDTAFVAPGKLEVEGEPEVAITPTIKVRSPDHLFKTTSPAIKLGGPDHLYKITSPAIKLGSPNRMFKPTSPAIKLGTPDRLFKASSPAIKLGTPDHMFKPTSAELDTSPVKHVDKPSIFVSKSVVNSTNTLTLPNNQLQILSSSKPLTSGIVKFPAMLNLTHASSILKPRIKLSTKKCLVKINDSHQIQQIVSVPEAGGPELNKQQLNATVAVSNGLSPTGNTFDETFILKIGKKSHAIKRLTLINKTKAKSMDKNDSLTRSNRACFIKKRKKSKETLKSLKSYAEIENIYLEHHYSKKVTWKPLTLHGLSGKSGFNEPSYNDSYESGLPKTVDREIILSQESAKMKLPFLLPKLSKVISNTENSSVVVVSPFSRHANTFAKPNNTLKKRIRKYSQLRSKMYQLYDCNVCAISFLTSATLELHKAVHHHSKPDKNVSVDREQSEIEAESSNESTISADSDGDEKYSQIEKVQVSKKRVRRDKSYPMKFENNIVSIPNLYALKKFPKSKQRPIKNTDGKKFNYSDNFISKNGRLCRRTKKLIAEDDFFTNKKNSKRYREDLSRSRIQRKLDDLTTKTSDSVENSEKKVLHKDIALKNQPIVLIPKLDISALQNNKMSPSNEENSDGSKLSNKEDVKQTVCNIETLDSSNVKDTSFEKLPSNDDSLNERSSRYKSRFKSKNDTTKITGIQKPIAGCKSVKQEKSPKISSTKKQLLKRTVNNNIVPGQKVKFTESSIKIEDKREISKTPGPSLKTNVAVKGNTENNTTDDYKCKLCNKRFAKTFQLRRHITKDHKTVKHKLFRCCQKSCGRAFETKRELDKHARTHRKTVPLFKKW